MPAPNFTRKKTETSSTFAYLIEGLNGGHSDEADIEDPRIAAMQEAVNDELFMADLRETDEVISALQFQLGDAQISPFWE